MKKTILTSMLIISFFYTHSQCIDGDCDNGMGVSESFMYNYQGLFKNGNLIEGQQSKVVFTKLANGNYSRNPEPLSINLNELERRVIKENADIGLATDPDGDRLSIVSNKGIAIGEELSLPLAIMNYSFYSSQPETFVTNLSTSMMVDDVVSSFNGTLIRSKIGEANVVSLMKKYNVNLGGEGNGGIILKEAHLGRDSLVGTAMVLNLMSIKSKSLSNIITEIPQYVFIKDKIELNSGKEIDIDSLDSIFNSDEINKLDGIKFIWKDKWLHIRKSNTEPILRIFAEGTSMNELQSLQKKLEEFVR